MGAIGEIMAEELRNQSGGRFLPKFDLGSG